MSLAIRGYISNADTPGSSYTVPFTGWTGANPQVGDFLVSIMMTWSSGSTFSQTAGTTWTLGGNNGNPGSSPNFYSFCSAWAYHVYAPGDTAPTFAGANASFNNILTFAVYSTENNNISFDAITAAVVNGAGSTGSTPGTATASASTDMALVLNACLSPSGTSVSMSTPCSGFTAVFLNNFYTGQYYWSTSAYFATPVNSGTVTPGAETFGTTVQNNAYTLLITEARNIPLGSLPNFPVRIVTSSGWRNAGHSR